MNKYKLTFLALIAAMSAFSANLHAQENDVVELDDYEVVGKYLQNDQINALKSPTPIEDVPQSLTILTSDLISLQDLDGMSAIADYVPGIDAGQGEGHRDDILFRGQKTTADFFVDGVRDDVQYFRPLYNVEQIEVLKGANALFFGRGGIGGVINRVSKTAQFGENFTGYSASFNDEGGSSLQLDYNMALSPNAALRLNYYSEDLANHRTYFYGDNSGINPTLKYALTDNTIINLSYENLDQERYIDRGIPTVSKNPVESLAGITFGSENDNLSTLDADIVKLSIDHKLDEDTKLRFNYTDNEFAKMYQNLYADAYVASPESVTLAGYRDNTDRSSNIYSIDLIGEKEINGYNHKYVIGLEKIDTSNNNKRYYMNTDTDNAALDTSANNKGEKILLTGAINGPLDLSNEYYDFTTEHYDQTEANLDVTSIYFSDEIALTNKIDLVLGGRLDTYEVDVVDVIGESGGNASKKDEEFSPRLGFVYNPQENVTYYASYSETFLPAAGDQYADLNSGTGKHYDTLGPDVFENTEIGAKVDLDNGISVTASLYNLSASKPEGSAANTPPDYEVKQVETKGIEMSAIGNISENWFISAGANFIRGNVPNEVAKQSFSVWNLYTVNEKLSLGLGVVKKGSSLGNKAKNNLPAYTRIDAAAYYKIDDNMRLQLNVENVTDELYFPNSYSTHQVTVGAPLNATIKIVGRF